MFGMIWVHGLALMALGGSAIAILPGSLGVLKWTHKFTAQPAGAHFSYVLALPLYLLSAFALLLALALNLGTSNPWILLGAVTMAFLGLSVFGFLMHTRFMFQPVRRPQYISMEEAIARFGAKEEVIGVLDRRGRAFAYITRLARRPHIVYQTESDARFIMSHCILSHSSMAYELNGYFSPDRIFISSVLANNLVFYDQASHCSVMQILNRSTDQSRQLRCLPTVMTSLGAWKRLYPESKIWVRPREWRDAFYLKLLARASVIDPNSSDLVYPLANKPDPRLPLKSYVLGVEIKGQAKAYPLEIFKHHSVIQDRVGEKPLVFLAPDGGDFIQLFSRETTRAGALDFRSAAAGGFLDVQTGSSWDEKGNCLSGDLKGTQLEPIPHYNKIFWCVWADFYRSTAVYGDSNP